MTTKERMEIYRKHCALVDRKYGMSYGLPKDAPILVNKLSESGSKVNQDEPQHS